MAIDPSQIELSHEMKQALAEMAEQAGKPWDEVLWEAIKHSPSPEPAPPAVGKGESFYDSMRELIGIVKDAPPDLSTNPKYMEGFGRDRQNGAD